MHEKETHELYQHSEKLWHFLEKTIEGLYPTVRANNGIPTEQILNRVLLMKVKDNWLHEIKIGFKEVGIASNDLNGRFTLGAQVNNNDFMMRRALNRTNVLDRVTQEKPHWEDEEIIEEEGNKSITI